MNKKGIFSQNICFSHKAILALLTLFGFSFFLVISCTQTKNEGSSFNITHTETDQISSSATINVIKSTPTNDLSSPTITNTYSKWVTIGPTQFPYSTQIVSPVSKEMLYDNVIIKFSFGEEENTDVYLNLDDLNNSNVDNSDIVISSAVGNDVNFILFPANNATYYYPGKNLVDLNMCESSYNTISSMSQIDYDIQGVRFIESKPYCVFTNDNRIAVVHYLVQSYYTNEDNTFGLAVVVTVYNHSYK